MKEDDVDESLLRFFWRLTWMSATLVLSVWLLAIVALIVICGLFG